MRRVNAYRKSYKFCSRLDKAKLIVIGITSSAAFMAMIPAVPVFIAAISAVPMFLAVIDSSIACKKKKDEYRFMYIQFNSILHEFRPKKDEVLAIDRMDDVFNSNLFRPPLERYAAGIYSMPDRRMSTVPTTEC